jgi:hypothetical protein
MIVFIQALGGELALRVLQLHRNQFFLESARFVSRIGSLLGAQCQLILRLASNALLLAIQFRRVCHVKPAVAVK